LFRNWRIVRIALEWLNIYVFQELSSYYFLEFKLKN
jgi:hypothetical protein